MALEQAPYRVVASSEAVTFDQSLVDRRDLYPHVRPCADQVRPGFARDCDGCVCSLEAGAEIPGYRWTEEVG